MLIDDLKALFSENMEDFFEYLNDEKSKFKFNKTKIKAVEYDICGHDRIAILMVEDRYFKLIGVYDSWGASGFDQNSITNMVEVKPQPRSIIEYVELK